MRVGIDTNGDGVLELSEVQSTADVCNGTSPAPGCALNGPIGAGSRNAFGLTMGDINGDGILDLVGSDSASSVGAVLGNGDGTFRAESSSAAGTNSVGLVGGLADFNGDGRLDAVVSNAIGGQMGVTEGGDVGVMLGNGDGTFQSEMFAGTLQDDTTVVTSGDFNGDGKADLAGASTGGLHVYLGKGDGSFQAPLTSLAATPPGWVKAWDVNRDGKLDVVVIDAATQSKLEVLLGNGDGTFQTPLVNPLPPLLQGSYVAASVPQAAAIGDLNGDGKADVAVAVGTNGTGIPAIFVLFGNGDGTLQAPQGFFTSASQRDPTAVAIGDVNDDGQADLVWADSSSATVTVLAGGSGFAPGSGVTYPENTTVANPSALFLADLAIGDLNGDGKPDLAAADTAPSVNVFLDFCTGAPAACDASAQCSAAETCSSGICCASNETNCKTECVDLETDTANCGACGHACPIGFACASGQCACVAGATVSGLAISPSSTLVPLVGASAGMPGTVQLSATAIVDGTAEDVTQVAQWAVEGGSGLPVNAGRGSLLLGQAATVSTYAARRGDTTGGGLVTAFSPGVATVTASVCGQTAPATVYVPCSTASGPDFTTTTSDANGQCTTGNTCCASASSQMSTLILGCGSTYCGSGSFPVCPAASCAGGATCELTDTGASSPLPYAAPQVSVCAPGAAGPDAGSSPCSPPCAAGRQACGVVNGQPTCLSCNPPCAPPDTCTPTNNGTAVCVGPVCAAPDTPIATPAGPIPIASLHMGDLVYSVDDGLVRAVPIRETHRTTAPHHHVMRVSLANGAELSISAGHPTADGRLFGELRAGDSLGGVEVLSARDVPYEYDTTYDILPDSDSGTYFAGGALIGSTLTASRPHIEMSVAIAPLGALACAR